MFNNNVDINYYYYAILLLYDKYNVKIRLDYKHVSYATIIYIFFNWPDRRWIQFFSSPKY